MGFGYIDIHVLMAELSLKVGDGEIGKAAYRGVLDASTSPPKERYAVSKDNIIKLIQPGNVDDQLTEILRNGARALLAQAVEAEVADFLGKHADLKTEDGHQRVVRHGHLPEPEVMTGIGPVDQSEKAQELAMSMARHAVPDNRTSSTFSPANTVVVPLRLSSRVMDRRAPSSWAIPVECGRGLGFGSFRRRRRPALSLIKSGRSTNVLLGDR